MNNRGIVGTPKIEMILEYLFLVSILLFAIYGFISLWFDLPEIVGFIRRFLGI